MTDSHEPDLSAEKAREEEAAAGGIESRAVVLDIDADDAILDTLAGDADADDDDAIEDPDPGMLEAGV
jgi:hypothetical protein